MCNFRNFYQWLSFMPKMAISKIGPYVNEPKFYTGIFHILVFKVILGSFGALVSKCPLEVWLSVNMYMGYL